MRIKKRDITENRQKAEKLAKDAVKDLEPIVKGIEEPIKAITGDESSAKKIAADIASDSIKQAYGAEDNNVMEVAVSDNQRAFFNAVLKCKVDGDCPSEKIKKAASSMTKDQIEDFAYTKGDLPKSVDEVDPGTGEDFGDIGPGGDIEAGEDYYELLKQYHGTPVDELPNDDEINDLPFESVRPKMTKEQLIESVLGKKTRKVLKTIKVKNLGK